MHVWVWYPNPAGLYSSTNPDWSLPSTQGLTHLAAATGRAAAPPAPPLISDLASRHERPEAVTEITGK